MNCIKNLMLSILLICISGVSLAQETIVKEHTMESKVLNEKQKFTVYLPQRYDELPDNQYPVLYVLDGKFYKEMVKGVITRYYQDGLIPYTIIVAIENEDRIRDYTPTPHATADVPSGKADNFLDYIEKELIPFVDSNYQTSDFRTLTGHSLGGLLSLYAIQARPKLFTAHYALSPSLGWSDNKTVTKLRNYLSSREELNQFLYMNLGNEVVKSDYASRNAMRNDFIELQAFLEENKPKGFRVKSEVLNSLPHASTNIVGLVHATNELYRHWVLPFHVMENGPEAITKHYQSLSDDLYYEVKPQMGAVNYAADFMTNGVLQPEKGLELLKYNAELYPDSAWVQFNLAIGYQRAEKLQLAKEYGEKALKMTDEDDDELRSSITEFLKPL